MRAWRAVLTEAEVTSSGTCFLHCHPARTCSSCCRTVLLQQQPCGSSLLTRGVNTVTSQVHSSAFCCRRFLPASEQRLRQHSTQAAKLSVAKPCFSAQNAGSVFASVYTAVLRRRHCQPLTSDFWLRATASAHTSRSFKSFYMLLFTKGGNQETTLYTPLTAHFCARLQWRAAERHPSREYTAAPPSQW